MVDTFVCLLLHVLIGDNDEIVVDDETDSHSIGSWVEQRAPDTTIRGKLKSYFSRSSRTDEMVKDAETAAGIDEPQTLRSTPIAQHLHPDRAMIYNGVKSTRMSTLTVAVEQVSIFLTDDGTVITFFQVTYSGFAVDDSNQATLSRDQLYNVCLPNLRFYGPQKIPHCYCRVSLMLSSIYPSQSQQPTKNSLRTS